MSKAWLTISLAAALAACGNGSRSGESPSLRAARLIDADRAEEAIALLEPEVAANPADIESRLTLASAFAKQAKVDFKRLEPLYTRGREYKEHLGRIAEAFPKVNPGSSNVFERKLQAFAEINSYLSSFSELFVLLPRLSDGEAKLLTHAVKVLEEGGETRRPSDHLYSVLLRTILLRDLLVTRLFGEFKSIPKFLPLPQDPKARRDFMQSRGTTREINPAFQNCTVELDEVAEILEQATEHVVKGTQELAAALPKSERSILKAGDAVAVTLSALTAGTSSLMIADEAASVIVQENLIEQGLGRLVRCPEPDAPKGPTPAPSPTPTPSPTPDAG